MILLQILSCLPLSFLDPVDQIRCFVGLFVVCYHGNYDLKKGCLPLLTLLVESSTGVLKAVDLNVFMNAVFKLYTHQVLYKVFPNCIKNHNCCVMVIVLSSRAVDHGVESQWVCSPRVQ